MELWVAVANSSLDISMIKLFLPVIVLNYFALFVYDIKNLLKRNVNTVNVKSQNIK